MARRTVESMSKSERERTPLQFARHLVERVLAQYGGERVAVLWVCRTTLYSRLWPVVDMWGVRRDARTYDGPLPIIAHPPCGPWGKLAWRCEHQSPEHGIRAIELVHRFGGVVEQPEGSQLFKLHGQGGRIEVVDQADYGHAARKRTLLYWSE